MDETILYELFKRFPAISTDTRKIIPNSLFFALKGESFDGNAFADDALAKGAAYAVIDNPSYRQSERYILVEDALGALQKLARTHRGTLNIPVIGLTGSNGKTTTKELLHTVLSRKYRTHATRGNLNNHIGVPLTLLEITADVEIAVIEMGANHPGEIAILCDIALPTHGLITNIGKAHLEGFGSFEGVKSTKGELYDYLATHDGQLFIQGDNPILQEVAKARFGASASWGGAYTYGLTAANCISGSLIAANPFLALHWQKNIPEGNNKQHRIDTQLAGTYNLENILAAVAVGDFFDVSTLDINQAIAGYQPSNQRSQIIDTAKGNRIIGDYYNANASSMTAALENFALVEDSRPKTLILGDMYELGEATAEEHRRIIELAMTIPLQKAVFIGAYFYQQREFAVEAKAQVEFFRTLPEAKKALKEQALHHTLMLLKGSRGMALEQLLEVF